MAVAGIVGPMLFTGVFAWSIQPHDVLSSLGVGTALFLSAAFMVLAWILATLAARRGAREPSVAAAP
jgi:hypothetical protein